MKTVIRGYRAKSEFLSRPDPLPPGEREKGVPAPPPLRGRVAKRIDEGPVAQRQEGEGEPPLSIEKSPDYFFTGCTSNAWVYWFVLPSKVRSLRMPQSVTS